MVARLYLCPSCQEWSAVPASGFFISPAGAFVTSFHVVANAEYETIIVMAGDGRVFPVREVLAADQQHDLAILRVAGEHLPAVPLSRVAPAAGTRVYVISHPYGHLYSMTEGIISRCCRMNDPEGPRAMLEITADFGPGSSGAPVLDERGEAVGWVDNVRVRAGGAESGAGPQPSMTFHQCGIAADVLRLIQTPRGD
jgi:S1-C subfamily serine protease